MCISTHPHSRRQGKISLEGYTSAKMAARAASSPQNIFHTQRPFSVLTLLAFGDGMYYICTEIWEKPRLLPFFVTFPLKMGVLGAHPGKICLPLIFLCLPQILIRGRQRKTTRREGKIGRRKVFPKVKNVNVESLKNGSKLLDFLSGSLPQPLPKGKGFSKAYPQPLPKGKGFSNFDMRFSINAH